MVSLTYNTDGLMVSYNMAMIKDNLLIYPTLKDKILKNIEHKNGCWEFKCKTGAWGYKYFRYNKIRYRTHRASYIAFVGEIPKGMLVCHSCDNRACCNPEHLFLGTHSDNNKDCSKKGRKIKPSNSKLNNKKAIKIRNMYLSGNYTHQILADKFKVSCTTITHVINNKKWKVG